ncbi:hypothetical protein HQ865_22915 [Mucilaginibacter mali]|uniref:DUF7710 domain-containing protein n=2 Tax=Mucilaginibacter mali TaxID=2740462 RepID=A0A7D4QPE0_9SPHI|nr:hypothetical protein HQ865_22915 [Mucilaginibacter mali]
MNNVWVFHGAGAQFASGVFTTVEKAEEWISKHKLTGLLTNYILDTSAYDWAIAHEYFEVKKENQSTPEFIQRFANANNQHFHYQNGERQ